MKTSQLRSLIKECVKEVLKEQEQSKKVDNFVKVLKQKNLQLKTMMKKRNVIKESREQKLQLLADKLTSRVKNLGKLLKKEGYNVKIL